MPTTQRSCLWCGRNVADPELGRRRQYCRQSCRQRAYEHRNAHRAAGLPADVIMLSTREMSDWSDRMFAARCAAEDVATAIREDADRGDLAGLAEALVGLMKEAERLR
ncbi:hypothetical protein OG921_21735 [Aldersonia sp. NBC_00410]|uniref:hypothetical protein n=1 Tax=Aldersonia sp. NBC_00410 TaxID=2975954 RepID=UPI002253B690|nr:hypothetical protein [Aldersonia sp. NBC_00410]MCX5045792.1 hypothetical protein [Aldersonia sp. NBC_00410]